MKKLKLTKLEIDRVSKQFNPNDYLLTIDITIELNRMLSHTDVNEKTVQLINDHGIVDILKTEIFVDQNTIVISEGEDYFLGWTKKPAISERQVVRYLHVYHWVDVD